ncbi:unnamed protein product [Ranitomeya imitator]|uniref:Adenosine deaminase domain-containing protein n=1 Tax=Ranitomeya imitator TaxID=111125 RepID=A0ABN9KV93_9NEOB|nr:unnamed protein product [Ranitomeya imitator]
MILLLAYDLHLLSFRLGLPGEPDQVELHIHLDATIRPETILHFARKKKLQSPWFENHETLRNKVVCAKQGSLTEFLSKFHYYMPAVVGDPEAVRRIAYEFVETKAKEGVVYVEVRYNPHLFANSNVDPLQFGQKDRFRFPVRMRYRGHPYLTHMDLRP